MMVGGLNAVVSVVCGIIPLVCVGVLCGACGCPGWRKPHAEAACAHARAARPTVVRGSHDCGVCGTRTHAAAVAAQLQPCGSYSRVAHAESGTARHPTRSDALPTNGAPCHNRALRWSMAAPTHHRARAPCGMRDTPRCRSRRACGPPPTSGGGRAARRGAPAPGRHRQRARLLRVHPHGVAAGHQAQDGRARLLAGRRPGVRACPRAPCAPVVLPAMPCLAPRAGARPQAAYARACMCACLPAGPPCSSACCCASCAPPRAEGSRQGSRRAS